MLDGDRDMSPMLFTSASMFSVVAIGVITGSFVVSMTMVVRSRNTKRTKTSDAAALTAGWFLMVMIFLSLPMVASQRLTLDSIHAMTTWVGAASLAVGLVTGGCIAAGGHRPTHD